MNEIYSIFAEYYDQLMDNYDYQGVFDFLVQTLEEERASQGPILEMACGTGKLTGMLTKLGPVDAFDLSDQMLALAYQRLYRNKRARIFNMDMTSFDLNKKYQVILCLCDSLNYLDSIDKIRSCFRSVKAHLANGGVFIFDMNTEYRFREVFEDHIQIEEGEDHFITWANHYEKEAKRNTYSLNFFTREGDLYRRAMEEHYEYAYTMEEIDQALSQAGLSIASIRNAYSQREDLEKAERLVYIVRNKEIE